MRTVVLMGAFTAVLSGQTGLGGLGGFGDVARMQGGAGSASSSDLRFTPWLSLLGSYNRTLDDQEKFAPAFENKSLVGMAGITGGHRWAHTLLAGGYVGQARYSKVRGIEDRLLQNHVAQLSLFHIVSPRLSLNFAQLAGTALGGYGMGAGLSGFGGFGGLSGLGTNQVNLYSGFGDPSFGNPSDNGVVDSSFLDRRTNFSLSSGGVQYRMSARWSAGAQGGAAFARRDGGLVGVNLQNAGGYAAYMIDERTSVQIQYGHNWIDYPRRFGGVRSQVLGAGLGRQITPRSMIRLFGGVFDIRSDFIGRVAIDPEIAAILGAATGYETRKIRFQSVAGGLSFSQNWDRNHLTASLSRGMMPGTDLLLAGYRDQATITFGRSLAPRVNAHLTATGMRSKGVVGLTGHINNYQFMSGISVHLVGQLRLNTNFAYRIVEIPDRTRTRGVMATAGLTWTPREWGLAF